MVTTFRLHSFSDKNPANKGTVDCDFRGTKFVGKNQGDNHHTLWEHDFDDSTLAGKAEVAAVLEFGPAINKWLQGETDHLEIDIASMIGPIGVIIGKLLQMANQLGIDTLVGLRVGMWSKKAEDGS